MKHVSVIAVSTILQEAPGPFMREWTEFLMQTLWQRKAPVTGTHIVSSCLLPHARNVAVAKLFELYGEWTHCLFIDSDMVGFDADTVNRLLSHDKPIVGALCTRRMPPYEPACEHEDRWEAIYEELQKPEPGIVRRDYVGMACTLIKREVFEKLTQYDNPNGNIQGARWFDNGSLLRHDWEKETQAYLEQSLQHLAQASESVENDQQLGELLGTMLSDAIKHGMGLNIGGWSIGEDMDFCYRAMSEGYESYVDCGLIIGHLRQHPVDIRHHLRRLRLGALDDDPNHDLMLTEKQKECELATA